MINLLARYSRHTIYNTFACIVLSAIVVNCNGCRKKDGIPRDYTLCYEYKVPDLEEIYTNNGVLIGYDRKNTYYLWYWCEIEDAPIIVKQGDPSVWMTDEYMLWSEKEKRSDNSYREKVIFTPLDSEERREWRLKEENCHIFLKTIAPDYKYIGLVSAKDDQLRVGFISIPENTLNWVKQLDDSNYSRTYYLYKLVFSPDGSYLALVGDNNGGYLLLIDIQQKKVKWEINPSWSVHFNDMCFSPNSEYIFVGGNGGVYRVDTKDGKITYPWSETKARCVGVDASPDGRFVAAGSIPDGTAYIIDAKTGKTIHRIHTYQYSLYKGVAFSSDSRYLATEGVMKTGLKIWKLPEPDNQP